MKYGKLLNQYRKINRLSKNALAKSVGISSVYLGEILSGKKKPPQKEIQLSITQSIKLSLLDKAILCDLAAAERAEVPADIDLILREHPELIGYLRKIGIGEKSMQNKKLLPVQEGVKAKSHTAQYRMHKYFARRPYNVFRNLVGHYTQKNDLVLDCFVGGGVTVFESAAMERKVVGVDVNPLSTFITRQQMFNGDIVFAEKYLRKFVEDITEKFKIYYELDIMGKKGTAKWTELAYTVKCSNCESEIVLKEENKVRNGVYFCPNINCECHDTGVKRVDCEALSSTILRVKYSCSEGDVRMAEAGDFKFVKNLFELEKRVEKLEFKPDFKLPLDWDRQHEDKLSDKGFKTYSDIYTKRNYLLNCLIYNEIIMLKENIPTDVYELLYFLFSSSLRYSNNMSRVTANWEGGNPTSMDKHAYWFPNQYVETNITDILNKRLNAVLKGIKYSSEQLNYKTHEVKTEQELLTEDGAFMVLNQSSSDLPFGDETFDVVITDPPYGSNVQYAELSTVWNAWFQNFAGLDNYIYKEEEAVMNRKVKVLSNPKTEVYYEQLLFDVFKECNRVLKSGHYLVFTFNNKNLKVWIAMLNAVARSGFYLPQGGVLFQDFIESYKNTSHLRYSGNIHGDFIYSFIKGENPINTTRFRNKENIMEVIKMTILDELDKLFSEQSSYTTTDLYQLIFSQLVITIMDFINQFGPIKDISEIKDVSDEVIENILKEQLVLTDGYWKKRGSNETIL